MQGIPSLRWVQPPKDGVRMPASSHFRLRPWAACSILVLCLNPTASLHAQQGGSTALPPGDGKELVAVVCTPCHALRPTLMRRDGREGWKRVVEEMVLRGAQLAPEEADLIVQYLVQNFGPRAPATGTGNPAAESAATRGASPPGTVTTLLPPGPGKELVESRCTLCHDLSRVVAVKRSRPEWEQITKDMMARGAQATAEQIQAIASYLAAQFGR